MNYWRVAATAGFPCIALLSIAATANADALVKHPAYLHALSDLRTARWLIEHQPGDSVVSSQANAAVVDIDVALADIRRASIDDGKDLHEHAPVDAPNELPGHLHKALQLLKHARADIAQEEDDSAIRGLRGRALKHVNAAIYATERAASVTRQQ
jgi:hypothetical protein